MKICAVSDLHGQLIDIPECDLLLIAGDVCPTESHKHDFQESWLDTNFRYWLKKVPAKKIVGIAGNHDLLFEENPRRVPVLPWTYLQDSGTYYEDLKIWGTPWQRYFYGWAFNLYEIELNEKWALIPIDTDIIVAHSPPYGYGDLVTDGHRHENVGSPGLLARIEQIKPKLVVFGHVHEGRGKWTMPSGTILANVTVLDHKYQQVYQPTTFEL